MTRKPRWAPLIAGALTAVLLAASGPSPASAAFTGDNPYARGPAPTRASVEAERGPFAISTEKVGAGQGFGGGTISYPTDTG